MEGKPLTLPFFSDIESLPCKISFNEAEKSCIEKVSQFLPFRITPYYARLMDTDDPRCPIRLQSVPTPEELTGRGVEDPLGERDISLTPCLFKRYPRRAVFLVSGECAMYCRFCNRKRLVGRGFRPEEFREETLAYLEQCPDIDEVILSGGDPLMLDPALLDYLLGRLSKISHLKIVRISSRMPVVWPEHVFDHLKTIERYSPLWFVVHINHPREITPQFVEAIRALRKVGASVISQSVLLRQVNDCSHVLSLLYSLLARIGVKPYYLFQLDDIAGASHFKVRVETGLMIMKTLRRSISGICMPHYAVDITGGLGKVILESDHIKGREGANLIIENLDNERGTYADDGEESKCNGCGICGK